jgi:hypothetical protein
MRRAWHIFHDVQDYVVEEGRVHLHAVNDQSRIYTSDAVEYTIVHCSPRQGSRSRALHHVPWLLKHVLVQLFLFLRLLHEPVLDVLPLPLKAVSP